MPTTKPRISVTVEENVYEVYKGLAELQNRSVSSLINELMVEVLPHMRTMLSIMQVAKDLPAETLNRIANDFTEAEQKALSYMGEVGQSLQECQTALDLAASVPPSSNTGVTTEISANENLSTGTRGKGSLT